MAHWVTEVGGGAESHGAPGIAAGQGGNQQDLYKKNWGVRRHCEEGCVFRCKALARRPRILLIFILREGTLWLVGYRRRHRWPMGTGRRHGKAAGPAFITILLRAPYQGDRSSEL